MSRRPRRSVLITIMQVVALVGVGVLYVALIINVFQNGGKPLTTLTPQGPNAQTIQNLVIPVFAVAGIVFVLVFAAVFYIIVRFRSRPTDEGEDEEFPAQTHGNTVLEIGWTILPAVILAAIAVGTVITIINLEKREPDALKVEVFGQQWWWGYKYDVNNDGSFDSPGDITTATEMIIPAGRPVELSIGSNDVIHSFWIPGLNGKKDAVPGEQHFWKIEADKPGVYRGQCTEYCGLSHANMRMLVRAVTPDEYDAWVKNQQLPAREPSADNADAVAGEAVFKAQLCSSCHLIRGVNDAKVADPAKGVKSLLQSGVAPDLTHFATRGTFAGSIFNSYTPQNPDDPSLPGNPADVNLAGDPGDALYGGDSAPFLFVKYTVGAWLRNPPAMKPAYAKPDADGKLRGMPNLGLTEQQISQLTAYLESLK